MNTLGHQTVTHPTAQQFLFLKVLLLRHQCFTSTLSPGPISDSLAFLFLSAYTFAFAFIPLSLSRTSLAITSSLNSGSFVRIFLPNNSAGLTPVVVCGVDLYATKYLRNSSFQSFPSACAILILFNKDLFRRSTSPFAWGHKGVVFRCSTPRSSRYHSNTSEPNCGSLSLVTDSGKPWVVKISSKRSIIFSDVVDRITPIS